MKLGEDHIKDKKVVGHTPDGDPIVMIETHGGLFAFFTKSKSGGIETIAAAPHRGIGAFMCEQKKPGIKWNKRIDEVSKSQADELFDTLRKRMFSEETALSKSDEPYYVYYDHRNATFELVHRDDLKEMVQAGEIDPFGFLRKADFSGPLMLVRDKSE